MFKWNFQNFSLCTSSLILLLSTTEKILPPLSLLLLQVFIHTCKILLNHLFSRVNGHSSWGENLQSLNYHHITLLDRLWHVYASLVLQSPDSDPAIQMCLTRAQKREKVSSFSPQVILLQPRSQLAFIATRAQIAGLFCFCRAALQTVSPQQALMPEVTHPQKWGRSSSFAKRQPVPVSPFLQPFEVLLNCRIAIWHVKHSSQFHIISKFAEGALWPITLVIN